MIKTSVVVSSPAQTRTYVLNAGKAIKEGHDMSNGGEDQI